MCTLLQRVQQNLLVWLYSRLAHPVFAPNFTGYFFSHSQCLVIWSQKTWGRSGSQVRSHGAPRNDPNSVKHSALITLAKPSCLSLSLLTLNCTEVNQLFTCSYYNNYMTVQSHCPKTNEYMSYQFKLYVTQMQAVWLTEIVNI